MTVSSKSLVMLGMVIGSSIGGYLPAIFGADIFSFWSIVGSIVGGIAGIVIMYRLSSGQ